MIEESNDDQNFFRQYRVAICIVIVVIGAGGFLGKKLLSTEKKEPRKEVIITAIKLPPLPAPPPPPPPPPPPMEQKMIEQAPVDQDEPKPDEPKPAEAPAVTTNVTGEGGPDFGLRGAGNGNWLGSGNGDANRAARSRWGWYAGQVQARIADALRNHRKTRGASIGGVQVRVWSDSTGRIAKATLASSTGDASIDNAIRNEVLTGLQLQEAPPKGMPMPIVLRLSARRPN